MLLASRPSSPPIPEFTNAHPSVYYEQFLWNPSTATPLTRTDMLNLPAADKPAHGPVRSPGSSTNARAAIPAQIDWLPRGTPRRRPDISRARHPPVDDVSVADGRRDLTDFEERSIALVGKVRQFGERTVARSG